MTQPSPTACLLVIGNEVLSGRTQDAVTSCPSSSMPVYSLGSPGKVGLLPSGLTAERSMGSVGSMPTACRPACSPAS